MTRRHRDYDEDQPTGWEVFGAAVLAIATAALWWLVSILSAQVQP